jgi:hypothetical protein
VTETQLQERLRFLLASLLKLAADLKDEGVSNAPRASQPRPDSSSMSDMPRVTKSNLRHPDAPDWVGP